jgi:hypothetical protein
MSWALFWPALAPYMGLSLKDVNIGVVLINSTRIAVKLIPGDGKALLLPVVHSTILNCSTLCPENSQVQL